jgi:SAM-dependent methyltransferase
MRVVLGHLAPGGKILEIGAGTGYQARQLAEHQFEVTAVDLPIAATRAERVFPVLDYDGRNLPVEAESTDVVFTSNVLEHLVDPAPVHREIHRVLRPGGYCIHTVPSPAWRFWTNISNYVDLVQQWGRLAPGLIPRRFALGEVGRVAGVTLKIAKVTARQLVPSRLGEVGNSVSELWRFSRWYRRRYFLRHGFEVECIEPMGLLYTGDFVLGERWSLEGRERAARRFGSACVLYKVRPTAREKRL